MTSPNGSPHEARTTAYTDGACIGNPGPGGWAWAVPGGAFASGADQATTNQRMEISAALEAARALPGALNIVSDSTYVVKCFNDRWYEGWIKRGWRNASKQPVANQDLWKPFIELYESRADEITFTWVKGHSGDTMNDVVDRLATEAARTQQARSGDRPPESLGPADDPTGRVAGTGATGMVGWKVAVFGHRPPQLGGYDDNPIARDVRSRIVDVLRGWSSVHDDLVVLTGLGLGAEQLAAEASIEAGVPYVAVLPYPDVDKVWPTASRTRFATLLAGARSTVTLDPKPPASKPDAGRAAGRRDTWLVGTADAALVVWDGADRNLGALVTALERRDLDVFPIGV